MGYVATRDFTDAAGKPHAKGEPVEGLSQSEVQQLIKNGSVREDK